MDSEEPSMTKVKAKAENAGKEPKRGRPVGNHEEKRAELLRAAVSVIAREGYGGTSLRKVAKQAHCTTGAVTYYFANKEEMITAAAESLFELFETALDFGEDEFDLTTLSRRWLKWAEEDDPDAWHALFQLIAHARQEPGFAVVFQERNSHFQKRVAQFLRRGQKQGTVRTDISADILADLICSIGDGWMIGMPIEPARFEPRRLKRLISAKNKLIAPPT